MNVARKYISQILGNSSEPFYKNNGPVFDVKSNKWTLNKYDLEDGFR